MVKLKQIPFCVCEIMYNTNFFKTEFGPTFTSDETETETDLENRSDFDKLKDEMKVENFQNKMKEKMLQRRQKMKQERFARAEADDSFNKAFEKTSLRNSSKKSSKKKKAEPPKDIITTDTGTGTSASPPVDHPKNNPISSCITKLSEQTQNFIPIAISKPKPATTVDINKIVVADNVKLIKQIGNGSYGTVYEAVNTDTKQIVAVKYIKSSDKGLECLLEASIMSSISHPYINKALDITCTNDSMNIIQEMADCDIFSKCREKSKPSQTTIKKWVWQLCQAVLCLHKEKIIHGDIKSMNLLLFGNNVKLCDYTLSMKHTPGMTYAVLSGTPTHRAPEIWMKKAWDESSDIWSLACTIYEMICGQLLFPMQDTPGDYKNSPDIKHKNLNCIFDFCQENGQKVPYEKYPINYNKHRKFNKTDGKAFDLLNKMLQLNPRDRINIRQVLEHPYFEKYSKTITYLSPIPNTCVVNEIEELRNATDFYNKYTAEKSTLEIAMNIYRSIGKLDNYSTEFVLLCTLLMASKMNMNQKFDTPINMTERLFECEREIARKLNFRLHNRLDVN